MKLSVAAAVVLSVAVADAFTGTSMGTRRAGSSMKMSLAKYSDELKETAAKMVRPGYGLLACDESTGTVGTRLEGIGMDNCEENRRDVSIIGQVDQEYASLLCSSYFIK